MSKTKQGVSKYFGICKCCLDDGYFKNLWEVHSIHGERQVYGEMIMDCFSLEWQPPDNALQQIEQICDNCIQKLLDTVSFKKMILVSQHQLDNKLHMGSNVKTDLDEEVYQSEGEEEYTEVPCQIIKQEEDYDTATEDLYEDVEFLEDDTLSVSHADISEPLEFVDDTQFDDDDDEYKPKRRRTVNGRCKTYTIEDLVCAVSSVLSRQKSVAAASQFYRIPLSTLKVKVKDAREVESREISEDADYENSIEDATADEEEQSNGHNTKDLLRAVAAIDSKEMTIDQAAEEFNVSMAALKSKLEQNAGHSYSVESLLEAIKAVKNKDMDVTEASVEFGVPEKVLMRKLKWTQMLERTRDPRNSNEAAQQTKLLKELCDLMSHTNALPFKSKGNIFYCAYCSHENYTTMDDLRLHTINEHSNHRLHNARTILTPAHLNEVCKVDISNLICTVCYADLPTWPGMFEHLKTHNIEFEEAYKRIIPYKVQKESVCALCDETFPSFCFLVVHMNSHYSNYICPECGDTFLSSMRLIQHTMIHEGGKYPCNECGKFFSKKYRDKHIKLVHRQSIRYKCRQCGIAFKAEYGRHQHLKEVHGVQFKILSCEYCDKKFDWRPYYLKHKRIKHPVVY